MYRLPRHRSSPRNTAHIAFAAVRPAPWLGGAAPLRSSSCRYRVEFGFQFEMLEFQHDVFGSSRLIPIQLQIAALAWKQGETRESLLA